MREIRGLAALLGLMLAIAAVAWNIEPDEDPEERPIVLGLSKRDIEGLRLTTISGTVSMEWRSLPSGETFSWFTLARPKLKASFKGEEPAVETLLSSLSKLEAIRSLGVPSPEQLHNIELDRPKRRLVLHANGREHVFDVGAHPNGTLDYPIRRQGKTEVFLLAGTVLQDLESAPGPYMTRQVGVATADITEIEIKGAGQARVFRHLERGGEHDSWAALDTPTRPSVSFANYLKKLEALTISEYSEPSDTAPPGDAILEVSWRASGGERCRLQIWKVERADLSRDPAHAKYLARSTRTKVLVELAPGPVQEVERDLSLILGEGTSEDASVGAEETRDPLEGTSHAHADHVH